MRCGEGTHSILKRSFFCLFTRDRTGWEKWLGLWMSFGLGLNLDPSLPLLRALSLHFPVCKNGNFNALAGFPRWCSGKESTCQCRKHKRYRFDPWVGKIPLEEEIATHSSILAWRIPWTEKPGRLHSMG